MYFLFMVCYGLFIWEVELIWIKNHFFENMKAHKEHLENKNYEGR